nr:hypothetical protein Iba_chr06fCG5030 [Ipomoea batatas]
MQGCICCSIFEEKAEQITNLQQFSKVFSESCGILRQDSNLTLITSRWSCTGAQECYFHHPFDLFFVEMRIQFLVVRVALSTNNFQKYNPEAVDISLVGKTSVMSFKYEVTVMFIKNYLYDALLYMVDSHSTTASQA